MSAAKLLVHKIETGVNLKSLQITIEEEEHNSSEVKYSAWTDGRVQEKKDRDKPSRLVVKMVSGDEFSSLNIENVAKTIEESNFRVDVDDFIKYSDDFNKQNFSSISMIQESPCYNNDNTRRELNYVNNSFMDKNEVASKKLYANKNYSLQDSLSPLEYSLERVKENNARIMENIQMLNRTLNYTKTKEMNVFPKSMRSYPCNTCGKCFVYETGLRRHYSMRHALLEMQPRWQIVWTCVECFQVWPKQNLAVQHAKLCCKSNSSDYMREIKTSSLLQCEFCEKVFTSIPRLLRHSKIHTTANNYECNACKMAFLSYKTAEQHWIICPWLEMYYNFSLPKLLLCNACDRKFRNYDQLYSHRYKVGHFITKTHCNHIDNKSLGILVYQCEICSQWFTSIPALKAHRIQFHPHHHDIGLQGKLDNNFNESYDNYLQVEEQAIVDYEVDSINDQNKR